MKAMKRYIAFLPVFVWAIFFAGAEVKVENASIHRSGDSIRVSFKILVRREQLLPIMYKGLFPLSRTVWILWLSTK